MGIEFYHSLIACLIFVNTYAVTVDNVCVFVVYNIETTISSKIAVI